MATGNQMNIIILSKKTPRAATLSSMISDGFGDSVNIRIHGINDTETLDDAKNADVCIVDLMSSDSTVQSSISRIKSTLPGARIIALHIYKTPELIRPLIEQGIDGYLMYDPPRKELIQSIRDVMEGKRYLPEQVNIG